MDNCLRNLEEIFRNFTNGKIEHYDAGSQLLRLQITTPLALALTPEFSCFNLVVNDYKDLYYQSYTNPSNKRLERSPNKIFSQGLEIRCIQRVNCKFIIYCNSFLNPLEAGELNFYASGFELYDQEFGRFNHKDLALLKSNPLERIAY